MTFPGEFALKGVYDQLWNNTTGLGTYYEHCSQAGGSRRLVDFDLVMWVDYKLFPLSLITPAQTQDLLYIIQNPQPILVLHISLEETHTPYTDLYLATLDSTLALFPKDKALYIQVAYKGAYDQRRFKEVGSAIETHLRPLTDRIEYIHIVSPDESYIVDTLTAAHSLRTTI